MPSNYEKQIITNIKSDIKITPTDAQLNHFKSDLAELAELADCGDLSNELSVQPLLSHLYLLMKQAYDIAQSFRS